MFRVIADSLPAMVAYWDAGLRCRYANRAYELWFGVKPESMIGRDMQEFLGPLFPLNRPYIEAALRGEPQLFEREIPDPHGGPARQSQAQYIPDVAEGVVRGFSVLVVDVTERKRAEAAVRELERKLETSKRLVALATLAAGIAHEINNPLASIAANLELLLEQPAGAELPRERIVDALADARRVAEIVKSMRLLARGSGATTERVDVDATLVQSIDLAANLLRYRARVVRTLGGVGAILGDASQLSQVFVNLLVNAAQAMPESTVERNLITVATQRVGDEIAIEIADNGCGIPEELQARVFEPFFTTRDVGGGMGLGLSVSRGIVTGWGGSITMTSKVGEGSVFRVVLPACRIEQTEPVPPPPPPNLAPARLKVLLVDDDVYLASTMRRVLAVDHDVTVVNSGREALELLTADPHAFEVILSDLMMPQMSGAELYRQATARFPELARRFVIATGGAFTPEGSEFLATVEAPVVEKPFDLPHLRAVILERARGIDPTS